MGDAHKDDLHLEIGIRIGLSIAAGVAAECGELTHLQMARMYESLAEQPGAAQAMVLQYRHDAGRAMDPKVWRARMQGLLRLGQALPQLDIVATAKKGPSDG